MSQSSLLKMIGVTVKMEGYHRWPNAPEEVAFLRNEHRHVFEITVHIDIETARQAEFFMVQRQLKLFVEHNCLIHRGSTLSCEEIAEYILTNFSISYDVRLVKVSEDGENYAIVMKRSQL